MDEHYSEYKEKSAIQKLVNLGMVSPELPIGMAALIAIVGHGLYNLKSKKQKLSLYLIQYRLAAQGAFLGCLTLGMAYSLFKNHVYKRIKKE